MGAVFLAHDENLGRRVAVKVLKGGPGHDEERARRLRREALAASALNHPNIITIHEVGAWNGRAYMATEFIEGVTLRHLMEGDRLTPRPGPGHRRPDRGRALRRARCRRRPSRREARQRD
jgi:serine/threonine protein kinase